MVDVIDAVEQHRGDLEDLAESDLPVNDVAGALLDVLDERED